MRLGLGIGLKFGRRPRPQVKAPLQMRSAAPIPEPLKEAPTPPDDPEPKRNWWGRLLTWMRRLIPRRWRKK
jgi:hypothetical protein